MRKKWLRSYETKFAKALFGNNNDIEKRVMKLCKRLGIEFTDDPSQQTEMWAQIGDYLALNEEEFRDPPRKRGRPRVLEDSEVRITKLVLEYQEVARNRGESLNYEEIFKRLESEGKLDSLDAAGLKSRVSHGKKKIEAVEKIDFDELETNDFSYLRYFRDNDCRKIKE